MKDQFNIVIVGTGGQGLITLLQVLAEAALLEGKDLKTSELHGLSQRGGSVQVHVRFGRKIYSPMVMEGRADVVLSLELQETLRGAFFAGSRTSFLVNNQTVPIPMQKSLSEKEVLASLKKISEKIFLVPASEICKKELGVSVTAGIYLLSLASFKGIIPLKSSSILKAVEKVLPPQHLELNRKTFHLAEKA